MASVGVVMVLIALTTRTIWKKNAAEDVET
jgi:hypothetical protein